MKIAIIGKGRVATHLSQALTSAGHEVTACGGRQREREVPADADMIILAIKDDAISSVAEEFARRNCLVVHTSGSVPMDAIPCRHRGVLYPMQTFSLERTIDLRKVPLFLETAEKEDMPRLSDVAASVSNIFMDMDGKKRRQMHLAAVFCCNFANHLYDISYELLAQKGIPFEVLFPLIEETGNKIRELTPREAQTGPAVRWDEKVISSHMEMLSNPLHREIYHLMSKSIQENNNKQSISGY